MQIDSKYRLEEFPLELHVIDALDFREEPVLLLEKDIIGNTFLSYLAMSNDSYEQRIYLQLSNDRLDAIREQDISLRQAFSQPENNYLYIAEFSLKNGVPLRSYLVPQHIFDQINPISADYSVEFEFNKNRIVLDVLTAMQEYADQQSAALKAALSELIPIAERMQATCEYGGSKSYDNEWDAADAIEYKAAIDRAKKLLSDKQSDEY